MSNEPGRQFHPLEAGFLIAGLFSMIVLGVVFGAAILRERQLRLQSEQSMQALVDSPPPVIPGGPSVGYPEASGQDAGDEEPLPTADVFAVREHGVYPTRLIIERLGIDTEVVAVGLDENGLIWSPHYQAGYYTGSSRLGLGGNTVIVGHVYQGLVFHDLPQAVHGDEVRVVDDTGHEWTFVVEEVYLVPIEGATRDQLTAATALVQPTTDERLTLITCYPETTFRYRFVAVARRVP
jgi:sortase A